MTEMVEVEQLTLSSSPHIRSVDTVPAIMRRVIIVLLPAAVTGALYFGMQAVWVMLVSITGALITEYVFQRSRKLPLRSGMGVRF